MIIVIYRTKDTNEINNVYDKTSEAKKLSFEKFKENVKEFSSDPKNNLTAEIKEIADDSLEAFLVREKEAQLKYKQEIIEGLLEELKDAAREMRNLEESLCRY